MSEDELSRVYTINLSRVWLTPRIRRTKRAINMIREFAQRNMKAEDIMIDQNLNEFMWQRGIRKPPRKIRVKMRKDEDDLVTVSLYSEEVSKEEEAKEEVKPQVAVVETPSAAVSTAEGVAQEAEIQRPEPPKIEVPPEITAQEPKVKKKEKQPEPEKIELSEEELAQLLAEESGGLEIKEDKSEKRKSKKSKEE